MPLIIVADTEQRLVSSLSAMTRTLPGAEIVHVPSLKAANELVERRGAQVLVAGPGIPADAALSLAEKLTQARAPIGFVIVAQRQTTELLRRAMRAGVRDVVSSTDPAEEIIAVIAHVAEEVVQKSGESRAPAAVSPIPQRGRVVTVFSTKGGVGKSTLSANLAMALVKEGRSTIIVDLDLQFGDIAIMLQLVPDRTIYDVTCAMDRLDPELLGGFLTQHSSGLRALLAPVQPEHAEAITGARIRTIIEMLASVADCVVIDTPATFNEAVLTALDCSDEIYAIATMDVPSIKNMRVSLQKLKQLGYDDAAVRLVLNRADSKVWLQVSEVEKALEDKICAQIPSDRLVPRSVNKGVPIVLDQPRCTVSRSICDLARQIGQGSKVSENVA